MKISLRDFVLAEILMRDFASSIDEASSEWRWIDFIRMSKILNENHNGVEEES